MLEIPQTNLDIAFFPLLLSGALCEAEVNECVSFPCLNEGVCVDEVNKFTCSCAAGFTGGNELHCVPCSVIHIPKHAVAE